MTTALMTRLLRRYVRWAEANAGFGNFGRPTFHGRLIPLLCDWGWFCPQKEGGWYRDGTWSWAFWRRARLRWRAVPRSLYWLLRGRYYPWRLP